MGSKKDGLADFEGDRVGRGCVGRGGFPPGEDGYSAFGTGGFECALGIPKFEAGGSPPF